MPELLKKHLTCTVKIFEYYITSNSGRRPERKKEKMNGTYTAIVRIGGSRNETDLLLIFPSSAEVSSHTLCPFISKDWKSCVELMKVRMGDKMLALEGTQRNVVRDTPGLMDTTILNGNEEHTPETRLNSWQYELSRRWVPCPSTLKSSWSIQCVKIKVLNYYFYAMLVAQE